jgi:hypothetical protein
MAKQLSFMCFSMLRESISSIGLEVYEPGLSWCPPGQQQSSGATEGMLILHQSQQSPVKCYMFGVVGLKTARNKLLAAGDAAASEKSSASTQPFDRLLN